MPLLVSRSSLLARNLKIFSGPRLPSGFQRKSLHTSQILSDQNVIKSEWEIEPSNLPYFDYIWSRYKDHEDRECVVDGITGRSLSFGDCHRYSRNLGLNIKAAGARKNDVLAIFLPNCVEWPMLFAGCASAGVTLTTLNPVYTPKEIAKQLKASNANWAATTKELLPKLKTAMDTLRVGGGKKWTGQIYIVGEPHPNYPHIDELLLNDVEGDTGVTINPKEDVCVLPFSSGTTGVPKGVMLSHSNIVSNVQQATEVPDHMMLCKPSTETYQSVTISVLPLFHIYAMNATMGPCLFNGGKQVILPKFDPVTYVAAMEKHSPTFLHLAPPLVSFLSSHPSVKPDHLESLEHICVAAAPSGPALIKQFKAKAPKDVIYREGWGMSETSPIALMTPLNDEVNTSCGKSIASTEFKVIDLGTGEALGPNERGELCVRGPQVMLGYLDNPTATAETIKDGWLHTGDIAIYDEGEHFYIVDRLKELIKVKGLQVPPAELEDLLRGLDGVADVAVIGIPHERFGEAPRAYIVLKDSSLSQDTIHTFMKENAAPHKQLEGGIAFVDAIPKSQAGKILRKDLLKKWKEEN